MSINFANIHRLRPVVLHRDEIVSYLKFVDYQQYIIAPCGSDIALDSPRTKSAKAFINEMRTLATAKQLTLVTTSWLTAQDLQTIRKQASRFPLEHPNEWVASKRIFAVEIAEKQFFSFYALEPDKNFSPHSILAEIIKVFAERKNAWGMAFWFSAECGFLGGKRPKDLLGTQAQLVLAAAIDEVVGITHG
jgi:hypothetical protein